MQGAKPDYEFSPIAQQNQGEYSEKPAPWLPES
jgi:hypothetical protein